ncbi:MAG: DUF512 domain-containing protein [Thermodesulfobacteriota bacterium]|nr:DUF512 domain-containing protein [Thermodesulfobacteriota bacterium]
MLEIESVLPGSIAEELDIEGGDYLLSINSAPISDQIDYQLCSQGESFLIEVKRKNGELWELDFERDEDDPLGLEFEYPQPRQCSNNCQFCFVRQLPTGLRKSLYVRDDDYRFSYLYGAYISLTNLSEQDIERILELKLSPLYVSVHATDVEKRSELLGRSLPPVLPILKRLIAGGVQLHTQIVLCPQRNDEECLRQSVYDLAQLYPGVISLAVVPVGLTGHRHNLPQLRVFSADEARAVIAQIHGFQSNCLLKYRTHFVFAADELYLQADIEFPALESYEGLALLENGVGLVPLFRCDSDEVLQEAGDYTGVAATLITGVSSSVEITRFVERFNRQTGAQLRVQVIHNHFFGGDVTVTGLLAGCDIVTQLLDVDLAPVLIVPDVVCREGDEVLLDDMSLEQIADSLNVEVAKVPATAWGILEFVECMAMM